MKRASIISRILLLLIILTLVLSACSKSDKELKIGVYNANEGLAHLSIEENKTFVLNRNVATSYDPTGSYTIDGDKLLLHANEGTIEFKINGNTLIFESGKIAEGLIKKGTEFIYEELDILDEGKNN